MRNARTGRRYLYYITVKSRFGVHPRPSDRLLPTRQESRDRQNGPFENTRARKYRGAAQGIPQVVLSHSRHLTELLRTSRSGLPVIPQGLP
jgi:hypothetical protein